MQIEDKDRGKLPANGKFHSISGAARNEACLTPAAIAKLQDEGVRRTSQYAAARSPFYRRRFAEAGVDPESVRTVADLGGLPLTSKQDIADSNEDFWCCTRAESVDIATTSGTSGEPTIYPLTRGDIARLGLNEELSFSCANLSPADVVLLAVTMDRCFIAGLAYFEGLRGLGATTVRVGSGSPGLLLDMIRRLRPTVVVSVPSFLRRVADTAVEAGIELRDSSVRSLICIGEPIRTEELSLNPMGLRLEAAWGAKVFSTYGVTELAASACECPAGMGGHIHPSLLHVEILDDDGREVPDGVPGEIVATTIGVEGMPVIRFKTGDCGFLLRNRCECGRYTPRIGPILGRKNQMMKIRGTTLFPGAVRRALDGLELVRDYLMIVTAPSALSDELEVLVSATSDSFEARRRIEDSLQGVLRVKPSLRLVTMEEIERMQGLNGQRKRLDFIDRR